MYEKYCRKQLKDLYRHIQEALSCSSGDQIPRQLITKVAALTSNSDVREYFYKDFNYHTSMKDDLLSKLTEAEELSIELNDPSLLLVFKAHIEFHEELCDLLQVIKKMFDHNCRT